MSAGADATRARELADTLDGYAAKDQVVARDWGEDGVDITGEIENAAGLLRRLAAAPAKEPDRETLATALCNVNTRRMKHYGVPHRLGSGCTYPCGSCLIHADEILAALGRARPKPEAKP